MNVVNPDEIREQNGVQNPGSLPKSVTTAVENGTQGLSSVFTPGEHVENSDNKGEYLKLYERQNEVADALNKRAKDNDKKDKNGKYQSFKPEKLVFDGDVVIYSEGIPFEQPYLFVMENEEIKEVSILPGETYLDYQGNGKIPVSIEKIQDGVYQVDFRRIRNGKVYQHEDYLDSYYIDKSGKKIENVGKLGKFETNDGRICSKYNSENYWGYRQTELTNYGPKGEELSKSLTIFDHNFNILYTIKNSQQYVLKYCDEVVCVLEKGGEINPERYPERYILMVNGKENLIKNEFMEKYLAEKQEREKREQEAANEKRARNQIPFVERFKDINHCIIIPNNEENKLTIINDKEGDDKKMLIEIDDFLKFNEDNDHPIIVTKDGYFRIENRNDSSDILFLKKYDKGDTLQKSVFINKKTGEKMEFDGFRGKFSFLRGKLIQVMSTGSDSEIYDENFQKRGESLRGNDSGLRAIVKDEDGKRKAYLYNESTGENLFEIEDTKDVESVVMRKYSDGNGLHYIIRKKDNTLIEVSP